MSKAQKVGLALIGVGVLLVALACLVTCAIIIF